MRLRALLAAVLALALVGPLASCAAAPRPPRTGRVRVVAVENAWGSIARQLGGTKAEVRSIITNPNTDPHDYEPTVADARDMAVADLVVFNGIGYDPWAPRILSANPDPARIELDVGEVAGVPVGGNPHQWYSPASVRAVVGRIAEDYGRLDPTNAAYFDQRRKEFETRDLARYSALIERIRSKYGGTPIGASESIVSPLAEALDLRLVTPPSFLKAISEGSAPTLRDKTVVDAQIRSKAIKVFIYNRQNATPDVTAVVNEAKAAGIPVVTVTETLEPATATFQDWQADQLRAIEQALRQATGR